MTLSIFSQNSMTFPEIPENLWLFHDRGNPVYVTWCTVIGTGLKKRGARKRYTEGPRSGFPGLFLMGWGRGVLYNKIIKGLLDNYDSPKKEHIDTWYLLARCASDSQASTMHMSGE